MVVDTAIVAGSPAGGALTKTGAGILQLTYTNSYAGGSTVNGGTLRVSKITAPAQTGLCAYTMQIPNVVTFTEPVARNMVLGQSITGTTISANRTVVRILNDYEIMTSGGHVNGFSTNIAVAAMSRTGNLGTGPATVNDTGTLVIDSGISLANAVTVNAGGTIVASGAGLGSLAVDGGTVSVDLDAGTLAVSGAVSLEDATLTFSGTLGDEPVTLLTAGTSLTGAFATVNNQPPYSALRYIDNSVVIAKDLPTLIVIK
jgi:autotransporter-associated beta strand protein